MKKFVFAVLLALSVIACSGPLPEQSHTNAAQDTAAVIAADSAAKAVDTVKADTAKVVVTDTATPVVAK